MAYTIQFVIKLKIKKKLSDYFKTNILVILGALLLIKYWDFLSFKGLYIALGIIALVLATYYIVLGIVIAVMGSKFSAQPLKVCEMLSVSLFALFIFLSFLFMTIDMAELMRVSNWVINILSMVVSLVFAISYIAYKLASKSNIIRFVSLFALLFILALLLDIIFNAGGILGNIDVFLVAIYLSYSFYLFSFLEKKDGASESNKIK